MSTATATPAQEQMASGIRWEEPPARARGAAGQPWEAWGRMLRRHPGRWARLHDWGSVSGAYAARKVGAAVLSTDEFELRATKNETGGSTLYARFLGDPDD